MNYENVYRLYFKTSQILLEFDFSRQNRLGFFSQLHTSLTHLRQSLSCYVCYQLLTEPHSAQESDCQHYLCSGCIGGKLRLPAGGRSTCSFCKNKESFVADQQLSLLIDCYGSLCKCILALPEFSNHQKGKTLASRSMQSVLDIVKEAVGHTSKISESRQNWSPPQVKSSSGSRRRSLARVEKPAVKRSRRSSKRQTEPESVVSESPEEKEGVFLRSRHIYR